MSHDTHNDHHNSGPKPVAFTVPLICAAVAVLVILLFVSLGDPCHCEGKCEKDGHGTEMTEGHGGHHGGEVKEEGHGTEAAATEEKKEEKAAEAAPAEGAKTEAPAAEEKKEEAHH